MHKKSANCLIGLFAILLGSVTGQVFAQAGTGNLAEVWIMTIKRGEQANFEAAFKQQVAVRAQNNDPRTWNVYVPETGDQLGRYGLRTCCFSWADQDAYTAWTNNNPAVMGDWFAHVDQYVESYEHYFSEMDVDNSNWVAADTPVNYIGVTDYFIDPAKGLDFAAARAELSQIALNQGWSAGGRHWVWTSQIGGAPKASLAVPFANFAAMAVQGQTFLEFLSEKMGADKAAALVQKFSSGTTGSTYTIWALRPDLSSGTSH
jgi:hypothetical protein